MIKAMRKDSKRGKLLGALVDTQKDWRHEPMRRLSNVYCAAYGASSTSFTKYAPEIAVDSNKHIFTYKDKIFSIADLGATLDATKISWGGDTTELRLFYGYSSPTPCRIYYYQQKRDGELVADFVPCYRKSDNKPGMYDLVTNEFFSNQGTGQFLYEV